MAQAFVWFHNGGGRTEEARRFYEGLLGWKPAEGPGGMTMFAGEAGPFASLGAPQGGAAGWVPYAQVDDVDVAAKRAVDLGAEVLQPKTRGPAGDFVVVRDPGGASLALWQKA